MLIKELGVLAALMIVLGVLIVCTLDASTLSARLIFAGLFTGLFYYYLNRRNTGFSIETALAQKSIWVGLIGAVPFTHIVLPVLR